MLGKFRKSCFAVIKNSSRKHSSEVFKAQSQSFNFWRPANFVWFYYIDAESTNAASPLCPNSDLRGLVFVCQAQIWNKNNWLMTLAFAEWVYTHTKKPDYDVVYWKLCKLLFCLSFFSRSHWLLAAHVMWQLAFLTFVLSSVMLGTQAIKAKQNNWVPPKK